MPKQRIKDPNAVALGRKGGRASIARLSPAERSAQASVAGIAASNNLTPAQRQARAKKASLARWSKKRLASVKAV